MSEDTCLSTPSLPHLGSSAPPVSNLHMVSIAICSRTSWGANDAGWARNDTTWTTAHLLYISLIFADFFDKITFAYLISIVCPKRIYQHWFVCKKLGPLQLELMYKCFGSFMWWVRKFQYSKVATWESTKIRITGTPNILKCPA